MNLKSKVLEFFLTNPSEDMIERFFCNEVLPYTKDSIEDILNN